MRQRRYSFSTKLSLYIILVTGVVFVVALLSFFVSARRSVTSEAFARAYGKIENTSSSIESTLVQIERAVDMSAQLYERHGVSTDSLHSILELMLASNPDIVGASFAFEPYHYKGHGEYFMPYIYRNGDSVKRSMLGGVEYNYFDMDWYTIPKDLMANYWSEPYYDAGGAGVVMTTFTHPLIDDAGRFYGVVTADISIDSFAQLVQLTKPYDRGYTFMLSRQGYYLSHLHKSRVLTQTVFSATQDMADTTVAFIGRQMIAGELGTCELDNDDTLSYVFYAPIASTDWSIATVVPKDEMLSELHSMSLNGLWVVTLGLLALFGFTVMVIKRVAAPLSQFSSSAQLIASGNFDVALPTIKSNDELGELHDSFKYMQTSLKEYIQELKVTTAAKQLIDSEIQIARSIQLGMIPKIFPPFPYRHDIDLYAVLQPAREVGGDLYDFFIADNKLYFIVGDVSGKGVAASLLMAVARGMFRSTASYMHDVKGIVTNINNSLSQTNDSCMFITIFVGVIDLSSGVMSYCNAGHNVPFVVGDNGVVRTIESEVNIPIGVIEGYDFIVSTSVLQPNDSILIYTDGVTEALNVAGEQYGIKRLCDLVKVGSQNPRRLVESIMESVSAFALGRDPHDDITMLALRYKASQTRLQLPLEVSSIEIMAQKLNELQALWGVSSDDMANLRLAIEESLVNIISYASANEVELVIDRVGDSIVVDIIDGGFEFDPTKVPSPDIEAPLENRQVGGLGILILTSVVDSVRYKRVSAKNILTLTLDAR